MRMGSRWGERQTALDTRSAQSPAFPELKSLEDFTCHFTAVTYLRALPGVRGWACQPFTSKKLSVILALVAHKLGLWPLFGHMKHKLTHHEQAGRLCPSATLGTPWTLCGTWPSAPGDSEGAAGPVPCFPRPT